MRKRGRAVRVLRGEAVDGELLWLCLLMWMDEVHRRWMKMILRRGLLLVPRRANPLFGLFLFVVVA